MAYKPNEQRMGSGVDANTAWTACRVLRMCNL